MDTTTSLENQLSDTAAQLQNEGGQVADDLQGRAKEAWDSAQQQARQAVQQSSDYVRENRVPALVAAFAFGLLLGRLFGGRSQPSFSERYLTEPAQRSRELLLPLAGAGLILSRFGRSAAGSLKKAVRR